LAVFIATPQQWRRHDMAPRQAALIHASLKQLQQALEQKGIPLYCHQCDDFAASIDWLTDYCAKQQVTVLFYN
ncbi:MAG: deoxyribodipyrimidine photo-lyase, partial [Serratia symbiotica]|nr:deoxyribodipyrimidine photo-lyase [Serratia symbiotica]